MRLFGLSGEALSLITQVVAFFVAFLCGLLGSPRGLLASLIGLGLLANIVGQIIFAGGGEGAFAGMCGLPLICIFFGYLGRGTRLLFESRRSKACIVCEQCKTTVDNDVVVCPTCGKIVRCGSCGYDLTGNVSGTCPECGTAIRKAADANDR